MWNIATKSELSRKPFPVLFLLLCFTCNFSNVKYPLGITKLLLRIKKCKKRKKFKHFKRDFVRELKLIILYFKYESCLPQLKRRKKPKSDIYYVGEANKKLKAVTFDEKPHTGKLEIVFHVDQL